MTTIIRTAYGQIMARLGEENDSFVTFVADTGGGTGTSAFMEAFPERSFNFGIAEQNMFSAAAGFSSFGVTPFVNTYGIFATCRVADQIRNSICYPDFNVKIIASHVGIDAGADGASHQSIEDLAIVRAIPNMNVLIPADVIELESMLRFLLEDKTPAFMRTARTECPNLHPKDYKYQLGKSPVLKTGSDVTIAAIGVMVWRSLKAAEMLEEKGISAEVINCSTLKPLDDETIINSVRKTGALVSVEDHNILNGLGGAISELLVKELPTPMEFVGINDHFGESGDVDELYTKYGMAPEHTVQAAEKVIQRKNK